ncbi:hypothetical protein [Paenibacillus turpanensis]|uniref:hypothetical protein n=1 Tax=Paenibacillus turpanensis TaxID=2689078 RepID=UPI00140A8D49|nr:hypothetical protein [Paenibacillus turpanensis]
MKLRTKIWLIFGGLFLLLGTVFAYNSYTSSKEASLLRSINEKTLLSALYAKDMELALAFLQVERLRGAVGIASPAENA